MSPENVEIIRALEPQPDTDLVTLFRDDASADALMQALALLFHDDFETIATAVVHPRRYTGMDGLRDAWLEWFEPWRAIGSRSRT
jgi:hypothetical protein